MESKDLGLIPGMVCLESGKAAVAVDLPRADKRRLRRSSFDQGVQR